MFYLLDWWYDSQELAEHAGAVPNDLTEATSFYQGFAFKL
jgi:hypothetical protein